MFLGKVIKSRTGNVRHKFNRFKRLKTISLVRLLLLLLQLSKKKRLSTRAQPARKTRNHSCASALENAAPTSGLIVTTSIRYSRVHRERARFIDNIERLLLENRIKQARPICSATPSEKKMKRKRKNRERERERRRDKIATRLFRN